MDRTLTGRRRQAAPAVDGPFAAESAWLVVWLTLVLSTSIVALLLGIRALTHFAFAVFAPASLAVPLMVVMPDTFWIVHGVVMVAAAIIGTSVYVFAARRAARMPVHGGKATAAPAGVPAPLAVQPTSAARDAVP